MSNATVEYVKGLENLVEDLQKLNHALSMENARISHIKEDMVRGWWHADDCGGLRDWTFFVGKVPVGFLMTEYDGSYVVRRTNSASGDNRHQPIPEKVSLEEAKRLALIYLQKSYDSHTPFWDGDIK